MKWSVAAAALALSLGILSSSAPAYADDLDFTYISCYHGPPPRHHKAPDPTHVLWIANAVLYPNRVIFNATFRPSRASKKKDGAIEQHTGNDQSYLPMGAFEYSWKNNKVAGEYRAIWQPQFFMVVEFFLSPVAIYMGDKKCDTKDYSWVDSEVPPKVPPGSV